MKIGCLLFVLACLSMACPAGGQDAKSTPAPPPPVTLVYPFTNGVSMYSIPQSAMTAATPFHAYGGDPLMLPLTAQAPLGTRLRVFADVSQQAGSVAAPWERNTPVSEEIVFSDRTSMIVACKLPKLRAVQRKTRVSVTLHTDPEMTGYPGGLIIQGFVYPREEPGAWRKQFAALLARSGVSRVAFFGHWKNPANFLREYKIAFDDLGNDWPVEPDAHTLYLSSGVPRENKDAPLIIPKAFTEARGVRLVVFEPWDTEVMPPGVYQTAGIASGGVWKVTLPDLFVDAGVGSSNPHPLEILTNLFEQILPPRQPATGQHPEPTPDP